MSLRTVLTLLNKEQEDDPDSYRDDVTDDAPSDEGQAMKNYSLYQKSIY